MNDIVFFRVVSRFSAVILDKGTPNYTFMVRSMGRCFFFLFSLLYRSVQSHFADLYKIADASSLYRASICGIKKSVTLEVTAWERGSKENRLSSVLGV